MFVPTKHNFSSVTTLSREKSMRSGLMLGGYSLCRRKQGDLVAGLGLSVALIKLYIDGSLGPWLEFGQRT